MYENNSVFDDYFNANLIIMETIIFLMSRFLKILKYISLFRSMIV